MTATRWPRILWITGSVLLVTMVVHIVALIVTGGPLTGPVSLRKPATFAETGWLLAWSTALLLPVLSRGPRGMRAWQEHVVGAAVALFGVIETAIMAVQAWRGVPSHYNFTRPFDAVLMRGGAAGTAAVLLVGVGILLVATLRARIPGDVRLGVAAGAAALFVGSAIGLVMIFNNSGVFQGSVGADFRERTTGYLGPDAATVGPELLLIRPATQGGDLVLPHAIGVHGLILLAVPAILLARTATSPRRRMWITGTAVAAVVAALTTLLTHALRGLPLAALSPVALVALGLCAVALGCAYTAVAVALLHRGAEEPAHADRRHPPPR